MTDLFVAAQAVAGVYAFIALSAAIGLALCEWGSRRG